MHVYVIISLMYVQFAECLLNERPLDINTSTANIDGYRNQMPLKYCNFQVIIASYILS